MFGGKWTIFDPKMGLILKNLDRLSEVFVNFAQQKGPTGR